MPFFSVALDEGQPEQAPCICQIDLALVEAAIDDVAAIARHRRADALFDQLLDLRDDVGILGIPAKSPSSAAPDAAGGAGAEQGHVRLEK
jgi:hypothetical protein